MPIASCCARFSRSRRLTWRRICEGSAPGAAAVEPDAHPAVAVVLAGVALGGDGVGEDEEAGVLAALGGEALGQEAVFVVEHRLQALAADVAPHAP